MPLRVKMRCEWVKTLGAPIYDESDYPTDEHRTTSELVHLSPVGRDKHEVNSTWSDAVPNGVLELHINNKAAFNAFTPGRCYMITVDGCVEED
jgi:hypothetical protein